MKATVETPDPTGRLDLLVMKVADRIVPAVLNPMEQQLYQAARPVFENWLNRKIGPEAAKKGRRK